jgi:hypothetical protein
MNHTTFSSLKQSTGRTRMTFDQLVEGVGTHLAYLNGVGFLNGGFFAKVNAPKKSI